MFESDILVDDVRKAVDAEAEDAVAAANRIILYRRTFLETPWGWRVLQDLLHKTGVAGAKMPDFKGNSRDTYNLGKRDVGNFLLNMLDVDSPVGLMLMALRGALVDHTVRQALAEEIRAINVKLEEDQTNG